PAFLPWIGWMDLADQVDLLIILDSVPFSKQSWQQRNRLRTRDGLSYVTVPVRTSGRLGQRIDEVEIESSVRREAYQESGSELHARSALRTFLQRVLGRGKAKC